MSKLRSNTFPARVGRFYPLMPRLRKMVEKLKMQLSDTLHDVYTRSCPRPTKRRIVELFPGVGEIDCIGCDGSGTFEYPDNSLDDCVECKGTGKMKISYWRGK